VHVYHLFIVEPKSMYHESKKDHQERD